MINKHRSVGKIHGNSRRRIGEALLLVVPLTWLVFFLAVPLATLVATAFAKQGAYGTFVWGFSPENIAQIGEPIYRKVFVDSVLLAAGNTAACLVFAYPMALLMATSGPRMRGVLQVMTVAPFFANFIIRIQAIKWLVSVQGPINEVLLGTGLVAQPWLMHGTYGAVAFGMIITYLPSMVLPLYVVMRDLDFDLLLAAQDLGARRFYAVTHVLWPMTLRGVMAGGMLVFIPSLGEFVTPELLGGGRTMLLGSLITAQYVKWRHWPFGAALSLVMVVAALAAAFLSEWLGKSTKAERGLVHQRDQESAIPRSAL
jgi:spermidine/putrescine transport system permease protein